MPRGAGIDVAADRVHAVVLDGRRRVVAADVWAADAAGELGDWLAGHGVTRVGIDSPDAPSTAPHAGDMSLSNKFRSARCGEIALGREHRLWVSWVTPVDGAVTAAWMHTGFGVFAAARERGIEAIEVFPHAAYRVLAGQRLPSKQTPAGLAARIDVLLGAGVAGVDHLSMWSHDALDAAAAALVAIDTAARPVTCGHDGSAIWIPGPGGSVD